MPNSVEFTATELATLDLWIAKRIESPEYWVTVQTVNYMHQNNSADSLADDSVESQQKFAKNISLDDLLALRNNAILKK
jgi:hypothetical protein